MKSKILSISIICLLSLVVLIPVVASAASSSYSFNMIYRVDGKAQGSYHSLNAGTATAKGHAYYNGASENWASGTVPPGETVTYCLYRNKSFADASYGCVSQYVSSYNNKNSVANISKSFPTKLDVKSSNYYLVITKVNNGWKMLGSGTLSTP